MSTHDTDKIALLCSPKNSTAVFTLCMARSEIPRRDRAHVKFTTCACESESVRRKVCVCTCGASRTCLCLLHACLCELGAWVRGLPVLLLPTACSK
jgi:hypothetical protein